MTEEEKQRRRDNLAKAREARATKRAAEQGERDAYEALQTSTEVNHIEQEPKPNIAELRDRLLFGLDPAVAAKVSDERLLEIDAKARADAEAEEMERTLKNVEALAKHQARVDHGLISAKTLRTKAEKERLAQRVKVRISVPSEGSGHNGQAGMRVDGVLYQNGSTPSLSRAQMESMQETQYRCYLNEVRFRTLDQHKPGNSAVEVVGRTIPQFVIEDLNA